MPSDFEFRKLLIDVANAMSTEDKGRFVFLLGDDIPRQRKDDPLFEIFQILINVGCISESDCSYLIRMLQAAGLISLAFKVARFENQPSPPTSPPISAETIHPTSVQPRENSGRHTSAVQEYLDDFNEPDKMATIPAKKLNFDNYGPAEQEKSIITNIEPESPVVALCLENSDLKTFKYEPWSTEFLAKINITIPPYNYQRELVQNTIQARNTIICLRTGGGKTFVAALLIKYYLIERSVLSNRKKFLAFFVVPRRAMLKQQSEKLKQFGNIRVAQLEELNDELQHICKYDVIVCTPQHLLNCLNARTIFLSNADLLCFDECHDSVGRHQYIGIMQYLLCTTVNGIPPVLSPPIVIGLTAAIGFHGLAASQLLRSLPELCAKFNCSTITTVWKTEHEEELERSVPRISEDEIICVDKQKAFDQLRLSIEKDLEDLILKLFLNKETNPSHIFPEKDFDTNGYEQNLELLKQSAQKNQNFSFVRLINSILPIYRHIKALIHLTPELVLSDLKDYLEMTYKSRAHPMDIDTLIYEICQSFLMKKLTDLEQSKQNLSNPKLDQLVELLKKHGEKPNSRILILVERTFYAEKICEFLQNHRELENIIRPCWLVGQNSVSLKKYNTKEDSVLTDFQAGICNVLISTDVVQAGLDIPQCSLVLRYDFVPDSIGTVQARARARAADCVYCLITVKDSSNYKKEMENREREQDLKEALDAWKRYPSEQFKLRVMEMKESLIEKWNESLTKALTSEISKSKSTESTGDVLCRACGYVLGRVERLRQYGPAYFIHDHDFYNRIEEKIYPKPEEFGKTFVTGKALCASKNCRAELGRITLLKDHPKLKSIYPLKCTSIQIRQIEKDSGKEKIILKSKWSAMPFTILSLEIPRTTNDDELFYDTYETLPNVL